MYMDIYTLYIYIYIYIYIFFFLLLLVTPDIPLVSGNSDAVKRLSSITYVSSKKLQEGASLYLHETFPIKYCIYYNRNQNRQRPALKTVHICGFYTSK